MTRFTRPRNLAMSGLAMIAVLQLDPLSHDALASSHSEAPGTARDRLADDTDVYAFVHPGAPHAVTFVGLWVPLLEPNGGPNFYSFDDEASYYINIDNPRLIINTPRLQFLPQNVKFLRDEYGFEAYYNLAITPWALLTPDIQVIRGAQKNQFSVTQGPLGILPRIDKKSISTSTVLGLRLQLVF